MVSSPPGVMIRLRGLLVKGESWGETGRRLEPSGRNQMLNFLELAASRSPVYLVRSRLSSPCVLEGELEGGQAALTRRLLSLSAGLWRPEMGARPSRRRRLPECCGRQLKNGSRKLLLTMNEGIRFTRQGPPAKLRFPAGFSNYICISQPLNPPRTVPTAHWASVSFLPSQSWSRAATCWFQLAAAHHGCRGDRAPICILFLDWLGWSVGFKRWGVKSAFSPTEGHALYRLLPRPRPPAGRALLTWAGTPRPADSV